MHRWRCRGGEHYKNVPSKPLAAEWSMLGFRDLLSSASRAEPIAVTLCISADRIPSFADASPPHAVAAIAPTVV